MNVPDTLRYTKEHEWVRKDDGHFVIGITDFAQHELGDVVFVDLPEAGSTIKSGDVFGSVESVKAVSDIYAPLCGNVVEINPALMDQPELLNSDPYGEGWLLKVESTDPTQYSGLMDAEAYAALTSGG